ncbi:hypothetical protein BLOT_000141 [Blomia tropicalis]|nr:hypothetical protein BLOT_000141 [Blomia tropicalis]
MSLKHSHSLLNGPPTVHHRVFAFIRVDVDRNHPSQSNSFIRSIEYVQSNAFASLMRLISSDMCMYCKTFPMPMASSSSSSTSTSLAPAPTLVRFDRPMHTIQQVASPLPPPLGT